jgi:hypothetical protein
MIGFGWVEDGPAAFHHVIQALARGWALVRSVQYISEPSMNGA